MTTASMTLVDGHVHLHACFDLDAALDSAEQNFRKAAAGAHFDGVLMLVEPEAHDPFASLGVGRSRRWQIEIDSESLFARAEREDGAQLLVVGGFQLQTAERLEVLGLGCADRARDGAGLPETIRAVRDAGALAALPWGAGKWLGRRGRAISRAIEASDDPGLFLGDNGGRIGAWKPRHFERATACGVRILPGSDPLPFASELRRVGSYGFRLASGLPSVDPARSLIRSLASRETRIEPFGDTERLHRFLRNQLLMQWRMRMGGS